MDQLPVSELLQTAFDCASGSLVVLKPLSDSDGRVEDFSVLLVNRHPLNSDIDAGYHGKPYSAVFSKTHNDETFRHLISAAEKSEELNFNNLYYRHQGDDWMRFSVVKKNGLLVVTTTDVTADKRAEELSAEAIEVLEKQRRLYESIISTTPDLVYVFDKNYKFTYANKALLNMWGKTAAESIGKGLRENGYEEWHALMHEREIDEVIAEKKTIRGTVSFPHAELGNRVYDYIFGPVLNENGEVEAIAGTTRDITGLKHAQEKLQQSEARFRNMIEQAPVAMLLSRGEGLVSESVNRPMVRFMNKKSEDEILGKTLLEALPELEGQPVIDIVRNVLKTGISFRGSEQPVDLLIDGKIERRYFNLSYDCIKGLGEEPAVLHMADDVTEQVQTRRKVEESESRYRTLSETLEQQVNTRTKELQRSNDDLQQFAHVASHDLKEPVRKIKTFTGRLEHQLQDKLDDTSKRFMEKIHAAADRMSTMIDGVLMYSSVNSGMEKTGPVDLNSIISDIESDLEVSLEKSGGKIHRENLPGIEGAAVLIYQLFYNLINNSIKFARTGLEPQIRISSEILRVRGNDLARITLEDNGIGFEPELAGQIFETFKRLNSKDKYEGTGLGLSLCKKIAERHNGSITARSKPGQGAAFIVTLPLYQSQKTL